MPLQPNTPADPNSTGEIPLMAPASAGVPAPPPKNPAQPHPHRHRPEEHPTGKRLAWLALTALGVVYGDIGTSPLYAIKETFKPNYGLAPTPVNIYGVLSLIVWALLLVVSVKYVLFILRADNRGEGGVLALLALVQSGARRRRDARRRSLLIALGLIGGAFLYGDGIITPAISVLSAVEGIEIATPALRHLIVPVAFVLIAGLFAVQRFGTARVGTTFGWITLLWFVAIAAIGILEIARNPAVLWALNPWNGVRFFLDHPKLSFVALGAIVLVMTGGEALYADMGHFGKRPIRVVWFGLVLPALLLNYFGQGALLLRNPAAIENPFYLLVPRALLIPMLFVATAATIVASQALISGAFSLTQQAIQLGYMPRMTIRHTSAREAGQIYIPEVNKALAIGTLLLVVGFGSSSELGGAYGVAVTGTMAITNILFVAVARQRWNWKTWQVTAVPGRLPHHRSRVLFLQPAQGAARRVGAVGRRRDDVRAHDDMEAGTDAALEHPASQLTSARSVPARRGQPQAGSGAGHRGLHDVGPRRHSRGAAASPEAQQGAARTGHAHVDRLAGSARGA